MHDDKLLQPEQMPSHPRGQGEGHHWPEAAEAESLAVPRSQESEHLAAQERSEIERHCREREEFFAQQEARCLAAGREDGAVWARASSYPDLREAATDAEQRPQDEWSVQMLPDEAYCWESDGADDPESYVRGWFEAVLEVYGGVGAE